MNEVTFKMKNDIVVEIEYTEIGRIELDRKYILYTDFVPENNNVGFRIFVAELKKDGLEVIKDKTVREKIISEFNKQILSMAR